MTRQQKLLVLVDGSERSMQTVAYLKGFLTVDEGTRIVLFHVFNGLPEEYRALEGEPACLADLRRLHQYEAEQEKFIKARLEKAKALLTGGGFSDEAVEIKFSPLKKGVARDIIAEAANGYSAVVMRRRGMGALQSVILGSVAVKLMESLTFIPVIIVGPASPGRKLLLAVDSSPSAMKAVEFVAASLGGRGGGGYEVCIFHAIIGLGAVRFDISGNSVGREIPDLPAQDTCVEAFKVKINRLFQTVREKLLASGFAAEAVSEKIVTGVTSRSEAIVREAEEGGYGTIVVGRRGLSRTEAFFMGRVGHKVVYGGRDHTVWVV
ncbi:MAG: universal stress protein [Thermodesulfobacteriota bacterium]